jgi:RNA-binding protein YlmH
MSLFDHFRKEELPFVERALEMLTLVERKQSMRLTDFLDPRQLSILQSLTSQVHEVSVSASGGYEGAERVRALLHPDYFVVEESDFALTLLRTQADQRFLTLAHRDVMGALLHIGLKREKFGDMIVGQEGCYVVVASEVADFVRSQVTHIHRIPVQFESVEWDEFQPPELRLTEKSVTVPSLRVDAVVGEVYHLSRAKALVPIRAGRLKVNWKVVDDPAHAVQTGDMISLAGFGRFRVLDVTGPTRSGRLRMTVGLVT